MTRGSIRAIMIAVIVLGALPGSPSRARAQSLREITEETQAIDKTIWFSIFIHNRRDAAGTAGECPRRAKLCIRADTVEPYHDRLEAWRCVGEQQGRLKFEMFEHPGGLRVKWASPCRQRICTVAFAQKPGVAHRRCNGVSIRVDVSDYVDF